MFKNKKLLSSAACLALLCSTPAFAYDTTTFSLDLSDSTRTGTMSLGNGHLGDGTPSLTAGANTYDYIYQYFTPTVSGTYVFGQLFAPVDTVIVLYSPTFSGASPTANYVTLSDDGDIASPGNPGYIADATLRSFVQTAIASRSCSGNTVNCPFLTTNLTAGVDYYVVVSTWDPNSTIGTTGTLSFFVIGDALVGVGGAPPPGAGYVTTSAPTTVSSLAEYLDGHDNSGQLATVATYLNSASTEQVVEALKDIFPVNAAVATQTTMSATGQTATVLIDKVGTVLGGIDSPSAAGFAEGTGSSAQWMFGNESSKGFDWGQRMGFAGVADTSYDAPDSSGLSAFASVPYKKFEKDGRAFWIQGVGGLTRGDSTSETHGYKSKSAGVVSGFESAIDADNLAGVILSGFRSYVDTDDNAGKTDASTYSLGVYGQHLFGATKLTGVVLGSYSKYDNERFVEVGGITGNPQADYNGWGSSATVSVSHLFEEKGLKIEPFVSGNFSLANSQSYDESGSGPFNMSVSADSSSTASTKAGVTFQYETAFADASSLEFKIKPYAGYQWELNKASNAVRIGGAANSTVVNGRDINTGQIGLALETKYELPSGNSFKLGIDGSHDKNEDTGIAYIGYGVKF